MPGQWLNLKKIGIGDVSTTSERNEWIDYVADNGVWLIEMWHNISRNPDDGYQPIPPNSAKEHLKYIAMRRSKNDIWVASFNEAVSYLYQSKNISVRARKSGKKSITISLTKLDDNLPWRDFNSELSLKLYLPEKWKKVKIISKNATITKQYDCQENRVVILSVKPTIGTITLRHARQFKIKKYAIVKPFYKIAKRLLNYLKLR